MNAPDKSLHDMLLPDIQGKPDHRELAINQVGVRGLRYPISLVDASGETHPTVATLTMTVGLPPTVKGTHMSRFVEIMEAQDEPLTLTCMKSLFSRMRQRLEATSGRIEFEFPYFIRKAAPVSGVSSLIDIDAGIIVSGNVPG